MFTFWSEPARKRPATLHLFSLDTLYSAWPGALNENAIKSWGAVGVPHLAAKSHCRLKGKGGRDDSEMLKDVITEAYI